MTLIFSKNKNFARCNFCPTRPQFFNRFPFLQHVTIIPFWGRRLRPMPTQPGGLQQIGIRWLRLINDAKLTLDIIAYFFHATVGLMFERYPHLHALGFAGEPGYQFRSEEIKQTAFRLDGVLVPPLAAPDRPLVFVEVQFQPDDQFYRRFFAEIFLYLYRHLPAHPWRAVVIYPERRQERPPGPHYAVLLDSAWV